MSRGWSFKCLSEGLEGIAEACPGGIYKSVQGAFTSLSRGGGLRQNKCMSRVYFILYMLSWGEEGGGGVCLQLLSSIGVYD